MKLKDKVTIISLITIKKFISLEIFDDSNFLKISQLIEFLLIKNVDIAILI